jgi:hypothetical protein
MKKINEKQAVRKQALEEGALDMNETNVYSEKHNHDRGTVHCINGRHYIASNLNRYSNKKGE